MKASKPRLVISSRTCVRAAVRVVVVGVLLVLVLVEAVVVVEEAAAAVATRGGRCWGLRL